jgi:hypothetical protein
VNRRLLALGTWLVLVVLAIPAAAAPTAPAPAAEVGPVQSVVVVGVPGLRWDQVSTRNTPALAALANRAALGSLSIRATRGSTCPADGWLSLGAGNRAGGPPPPAAGCPPAVPTGPVLADPDSAGRVVDFAALVTANRRSSFAASPGSLGASVRASGECTAAVGPGAALAAADTGGRVDHYTATLPVPAGDLRHCALTVVEIDPPVPPGAPAPELTAVDAGIAAVDAARPPGSLLIVVGLAELGTGSPRLHVALAVGPGFAAGSLTSASTRRAPYVQLLDVAPTVLDRLGISVPAQMIGQSWRQVRDRPASAAAAIAALVDTDRAADVHRHVVALFFFFLELAQALAYGTIVALLNRPAGRRASRRRQLLTGLHGAGVIFAAVPVATLLANLVRWERAGRPVLALLAAVAVATALVGLLALRGPWRHRLLGPVGAVTVVTVAVFVVDLGTGARLQMSSLVGYSPLVAGRFAGIGNVAYGVFAAAVLLTGAVLAAGRSRRGAVAVVAGIGGLGVLVDGGPWWGSDVGGVLALMPGLALLALGVAGSRITWRPVVAAGLAGVAVVGAFAVADYRRPPAARTHFGRFLDQLLHGGAGSVLARKATANLALLTHTVWTALVPVVIVLAGMIVLHPDRVGASALTRAYRRAPTLRPGLTAVLGTGLIGWAVNDSGLAIPALAIVATIPIVVAVIAATLRVEIDRPDLAETPAH